MLPGPFCVHTARPQTSWSRSGPPAASTTCGSGQGSSVIIATSMSSAPAASAMLRPVRCPPHVVSSA